MRVLDRSVVNLDLEKLGIPKHIYDYICETIEKPNGIFIVTGPKGSGKTTTLYSCLGRVNQIDTKILTVEDPVEYELEGIIQVPANESIGLTFARALRAFLRQDPDKILVGETRDLETAQIAIQASLTGHLVMTSLHTNDAAGAVTRLLDMGVEPYLVSATLQGALAQRLVRVLCDACATPRAATSAEAARWGRAEARPREARGCDRCANSGYRGRRGLYELFVPDEAMRTAIVTETAADLRRAHATTHGAVSLRDEGWRLVRDGITTPEEVARALGADDA
jgi:type IV pilus assembly protein PilB